MPSQRELIDLGRSDLLNAVRLHGGASLVARRAALAPHPDRAHRKPPHYWSDPKRLHAELLVFTAHRGHPGLMPRRDQLVRARRRDLVYAIDKWGGFGRVAAKLHLVWYGPSSYWRKWRHVKRRLAAFTRMIGREGVMPSFQTMQSFGRMDLVYGVGLHGGVMMVAKKMGYHVQYPRRKRGYWMVLENVVAELESFLGTQPLECRSSMPTSVMLVQAGRLDLATAIRDHGGWLYYAQRLGLRFAFEVRDQGFWEREEDVVSELVSYVSMRYGFWQHPGKEPPEGTLDADAMSHIPSMEMLKRDGRSDIAFAIQRYHGGVAGFAARHGWVVAEDVVQTKPVETLIMWKPFMKELHQWIAVHGADGIMPSMRDLIRTGRHDLRFAVHKHGGALRVSRKMLLVKPHGPVGGWLPQWLGLQAGKLGVILSLYSRGKSSQEFDSALEGCIVGSERKGERVGRGIRKSMRERLLGQNNISREQKPLKISIAELARIRLRYKHLPPDDIIEI